MSTTYDLPETTTRSFDMQDAVDKLEDAKLSLESCISQLQEYVRMTGDRSTERTLVRNLQVYVDQNHGLLAREFTIQDLIDDLQSGPWDDEDESDN